MGNTGAPDASDPRYGVARTDDLNSDNANLSQELPQQSTGVARPPAQVLHIPGLSFQHRENLE